MNKNIIITISSIVVVLALIVGGLFGWKAYAESHTDNRTAVDYGTLNPLVQSKDYYVKTQKPTKKETTDTKHSDDKFTTYTYKQKSANKDGKVKKIKFTVTNKKLKTNHYLKVTQKLGQTQTYKEVPKDKVPKKALEKIDK
ncbi:MULTISPECIES: YxeA family protein [Staphylococcus]|uniref:YxeA family protein n=1 Tax=Staphylococcus hsinchuensis TaxID=3051183 RepID=A0ABZ3EFT0_9STAP|nr:YxeA family protein [Staphylococcus sp. Marseille-Q6910]